MELVAECEASDDQISVKRATRWDSVEVMFYNLPSFVVFIAYMSAYMCFNGKRMVRLGINKRNIFGANCVKFQRKIACA